MAAPSLSRELSALRRTACGPDSSVSRGRADSDADECVSETNLGFHPRRLRQRRRLQTAACCVSGRLSAFASASDSSRTSPRQTAIVWPSWALLCPGLRRLPPCGGRVDPPSRARALQTAPRCPRTGATSASTRRERQRPPFGPGHVFRRRTNKSPVWPRQEHRLAERKRPQNGRGGPQPSGRRTSDRRRV